MSRRARERLLVRDLKHADAYMAPDPVDDDDDTDGEGNTPDAYADTDGDDGADFHRTQRGLA